jgi:hypothetical protein
LKFANLKHIKNIDRLKNPINATLLAAPVDGAQEKGFQAVSDASETEAHKLATKYGRLTYDGLWIKYVTCARCGGLTPVMKTEHICGHI